MFWAGRKDLGMGLLVVQRFFHGKTGRLVYQKQAVECGKGNRGAGDRQNIRCSASPEADHGVARMESRSAWLGNCKVAVLDEGRHLTRTLRVRSRCEPEGDQDNHLQ